MLRSRTIGYSLRPTRTVSQARGENQEYAIVVSTSSRAVVAARMCVRMDVSSARRLRSRMTVTATSIFLPAIHTENRRDPRTCPR